MYKLLGMRVEKSVENYYNEDELVDYEKVKYIFTFDALVKK